MKNNKPINIAACGMDKQTSKLLEMVFNGPGRGNYALVEQLESAQACIFDLDSLEGMNLWKDYRNRYPQMPTVILSLNHKDIAGTVYVQKPIEIDNLLKALNKIKRLIEEESAPKSGAQKVSVKSASVKPQQAPRDAKLATEIAIEEEEEALHQYCGYAQDINPDNPQGFLKFYYEPNQYLQGFFEKAFVIGQQLDSGGIMIEGLYTKMILMPKQNQILCGCEFNDSHEQPLDKFLWRVALWTSRGRVPKGTDLYKKIVLLYWPNFTRLIVTPYALKISALWMVQPHSLLETAKILEIPQRYVFALFTAARAIQLAFVDRRIERRVSQSISTSGAKRGIFQRLLARLRAPSS